MTRPRLSIVLAATLLSSAACGGGSGTGDPCTGSQTRCQGAEFQTCDGDSFETSETCAGSTVCDPTIGCAECSPAGGTFCSGDAVISCTAEGSVGGEVETCAPGTCSGGTCGGGGDGCDASGVELIYVVTADDNTLLSFDPEALGTAADPFSIIGRLDCSAGFNATPFSMSVDREGVAWVLYSNGRVFHVSTETAACQATTFATGQQGFELFGMGFVSDASGSDKETLYIAGGDARDQRAQDLGSIDTTAMTVAYIGALPSAAFGPELTGTGAAELYGFYPGQTTFVARMDKATGNTLETFPLATNGTPQAWAFAHYGGKFYIFVQYGGAPKVIELDPVSGSEREVIPNSPYQVVGAGVSTCAPVVVE